MSIERGPLYCQEDSRTSTSFRFLQVGPTSNLRVFGDKSIGVRFIQIAQTVRELLTCFDLPTQCGQTIVIICHCQSRYEPMIDLVCNTLVSKSCLYGPEGPTLQRGLFLNSHVLDLYFYVLTSFYTSLVTPIQSHKQYSSFFTLCMKNSKKKQPYASTRPLS